MFQSTRPRGRDNLVSQRDRAAVCVSIHAPARARRSPCALVASSRLFQSTRPRGRDRAAGSCGLCLTCFNPRARAGATSVATGSPSPRGTFQSTRPRGRDYGRSCDRRQLPPVSIHAPARARLAEDLGTDVLNVVSIHAPARARPLEHICLCNNIKGQHAREPATLLCQAQCGAAGEFTQSIEIIRNFPCANRLRSKPVAPGSRSDN